jgi:hypothetical protein
MGEIRNAYKIWVGKPEGNGQLKRPKHRWENNMDLRDKWTGFIWLRTGTSCGHLQTR